MRPCTVPPRGWKCTREAGHQGPCTAISDYPVAQNIQAGYCPECHEEVMFRISTEKDIAVCPECFTKYDRIEIPNPKTRGLWEWIVERVTQRKLHQYLRNMRANGYYINTELIKLRGEVKRLEKTVDEVVNQVLDEAFEALEKEHTAETAQAAAEQRIGELETQLSQGGLKKETLDRITQFVAAVGAATPAPAADAAPAEEAAAEGTQETADAGAAATQ
jgi:hypothetical protein